MFIRVNQRVLNGGVPREVFYILEVAHTDMDEVHAVLLRDGLLKGTRYETRRDGDGRRVVSDAFETIISSREGLVSIMEMQDELFDADGAPLWTFGEAA